ncbi:hypothetical protein J1N35_044965 [Gossypium stocksii]|uniref:Uncharacterized protein n=1 Tax=Gossypium stocksii TaxID=47602 RepID=A0A9D3UAJ6_9ROSI|nr:hypothetical protein J1N35_044965 [Gossypium stocksii]
MEMPPVFKSIRYCISASDSFKLQRVTQGEGNLPKLLLTSKHGRCFSEAVTYLFGGYITSWKNMVFQWWKVIEEESQKEEEEEQRHGISLAKNQTPPN